MNRFFEFISNHPILFAALGALIGMLAWTFLSGGSTRRVTPLVATQMINHEDAVVVDVRGEGEFQQGHIVNAVHIPLDKLEEQIGKLEKYRDRPIIPVCRAGQQSATACKTLRLRGFEKVFSLRGGILAWQEATLPLTKKS
jgi:rhodanese-related sulfurtransferase